MLFRKMQQQDIAEVYQLFSLCMTDLIVRENKEIALIEDEVESLKKIVEVSTSTETVFYVTEVRGRIAGTIALKKPNSIICENTKTEPDLYEIACVYVHPDCQRQGIGLFMLRNACQELLRLGQNKYCLDAGFSSSRQYWEKRLGKPSVILEDYWGSGEHHFIWIQAISDY